MYKLAKEVLHNSCNTGTRGLPDMYTLSPWALGVHIRQTTPACVTTIKCLAIGRSCSWIILHYFAISAIVIQDICTAIATLWLDTGLVEQLLMFFII